MRAKFSAWLAANGRAIVMTFEIFWILIFLLDRVTSGNASGIPEFIYVNF